MTFVQIMVVSTDAILFTTEQAMQRAIANVQLPPGIYTSETDTRVKQKKTLLPIFE